LGQSDEKGKEGARRHGVAAGGMSQEILKEPRELFWGDPEIEGRDPMVGRSRDISKWGGNRSPRCVKCVYPRLSG